MTDIECNDTVTLDDNQNAIVEQSIGAGDIPSHSMYNLPTFSLPPTIFTGDPHDAKVINVSFYHVQFSNEKEFPYIKVGRPFLEVEILSNFTLHNVAKLLFEYRLEEEFGEDLYAHVWRFEPFIGSDSYGI